ncbi:DUF948 domain-containing protein [Thermohalobacter berrensis]|uniref:DUF948 domain-containing protein n=1 Tax=Thermohalobacter berrensis TaxID=99594 RepID=A0A419T6U6_9FIRM|nr:DUF948 domain-containing protein [Thermohalobacter berrensis]RKD33156.1 hypothetical protein BET03_09560 [Thermohalobacter berrensis]
MVDFSQVIMFGFLILFAVLVGFIIPILVKAYKILKSVHNMLDKNEEDINKIVTHFTNTSKNVDTIVKSFEDKVSDIDKIADAVKIVLNLVLPRLKRKTKKEEA